MKAEVDDRALARELVPAGLATSGELRTTAERPSVASGEAVAVISNVSVEVEVVGETGPPGLESSGGEIDTGDRSDDREGIDTGGRSDDGARISPIGRISKRLEK